MFLVWPSNLSSSSSLCKSLPTEILPSIQCFHVCLRPEWSLQNAASYRKGCFFSSAENNLFHSSTPQHIVSTSLYHWSLNLMQPCYHLCVSYPLLLTDNGICYWSLLQSEETWAQKGKASCQGRTISSFDCVRLCQSSFEAVSNCLCRPH